MKDLEKLKSEDLACQVADANPANFAIEQEVAQLVGATVPQPTQPSADDARELPAQLLVFLRRALTPIRSALRTALAAIYAHLDSRCNAYTPAAYAPYSAARRAYDPMGNLPPRSVANLLTALTAFSARKISNGSATADGIPDGTSLAHLLGGANTVTKIIDDNKGWTMTRALPWTHLTELVLGCEYVALGLTIIDTQDIEDVVLPYCKGMAERGDSFGSLTLIANSPNVKTIYAPKLQHTGGYQYLHIVSDLQYLEELNLPEYTEFWTSYGYGIAANCPALKKIYMPKYRYYNGYSGLFKDMPALEEADLSSITTLDHNYYGYGLMNNCPELRRVKLGVITAGNLAMFSDDPKLIDIEIEGATGSFNLSGWNPTDKGTTFLQNFKDHIALRLTANGSGLTLTLSQAVFSAVIEGSSPICDDIKGIIEDKGWKVQDTNNNIFPTT